MVSTSLGPCDGPITVAKCSIAVIGPAARVEGTVEESVVWPGAPVFEHEHLVRAIRPNDRMTVLVNGIEIPLGQSGTNMSGTGWFSLVSMGNRTGNLNLDFTDGVGRGVGC